MQPLIVLRILYPKILFKTSDLKLELKIARKAMAGEATRMESPMMV
jgi:hypothetical protein